MKANSKISAAVAAILSAPAATAVMAAPADTSTSTATGTELQEVVVTANRREENLQNVPISVQALTGETLAQLNVTTIDEFVKYLPSVSTGSLGPGQNTLFMRGLSVGVLGTQGQGSVGNFPNVAIYLDDQSGQLPGRNLDIYAADLERVEVLEGPQGTLFGAGAEAGVVRYVTNKPKLGVTEGYVTAGYGSQAHGNQMSDATGVINLPIGDNWAFRMAVYDDNRGGYINNVPSTFTRAGTDIGLARYNNGVVPPNSVVINNYNIAQNAINPLSYQGIRLGLLWKFAENWDALLQQSYQVMTAQGVFYEMPNGSEGTTFNQYGNPCCGTPLPPLSVTLFNPNSTTDRWENTALTIQGMIGSIRMVYAGSYLDRNIYQSQDYTNYARGVYGYYYQCAGGFSAPPAFVTCYSPSSVWTDTERNTHLSQELRFSTPDDWRLRGLLGLFYEDQKVYDDTEWLYKSVPNCSPTYTTLCFLQLDPAVRVGQTFNDPNIRNANTGFFDDFQRGYTQRAVFASVDFDVIPQVLTITAGTRYFHIYNYANGGDIGSFSCKVYGGAMSTGGICPAPYGTNLNTQNPNNLTATGFKSRANLAFHPTSDVLLYYTWSQGYRPGGFNRGSSAHLPGLDGENQYNTPKDYVSDDLTNNEIGFKSLWWNHRVQFNGAVYEEKWNNAQIGFFCPQCDVGNLTFGTNGPNYQVKGVEISLIVRATEGLTITGSASWNSTEQTNSPSLINNNPASAYFGQPITQQCKGPYPVVNPALQCVPIINVYGAQGSPLANSPPQQSNLRARYEYPFTGGYTGFAWIGFAHQSHSLSATGNVEAYDQPSWTTYDGALGVMKGPWQVSFTATNFTNVNASLFTTSRQFVVAEVPQRPQVFELRFDYHFQEK